MEGGRKSVEEMAAVELAAGDEIESGDEEADPAGDEDGVVEGVVEVGRVEKRGENVDGERLAQVDDGVWRGGRDGLRECEPKGDGEERDDVTGQRPIGADIDQSLAGVDSTLDLNDGAGRAT